MRKISLLIALVFFDTLKKNINPITIGIIEELAKKIIVITFVRYRRYKYILNGLLIGAAVGAGFAAFETAGYALRALLSGDGVSLYGTILLRGVYAPGGHVAWAALTGAVFCRVQKDQSFQFNMLFHYKFLQVFILVVGIHALWDTSIPGMFPFGQVILMVISWLAVFLFFRGGLKEIGERKIMHSKMST